MPTPPHKLALSDDEVWDLLQGAGIRDRLRQVEAWLRANFPTAVPVKQVRYERFSDSTLEGECYRGRRGLVVRVAKPARSVGAAIETLIHEWAHAMVWPTAHAQRQHERLRRRRRALGQDLLGHTDEYWIAFGRIYRAWHDEPGWRRSAGY